LIINQQVSFFNYIKKLCRKAHIYQTMLINHTYGIKYIINIKSFIKTGKPLSLNTLKNYAVSRISISRC